MNNTPKLVIHAPSLARASISHIDDVYNIPRCIFQEENSNFCETQPRHVWNSNIVIYAIKIDLQEKCRNGNFMTENQASSESVQEIYIKLPRYPGTQETLADTSSRYEIALAFEICKSLGLRKFTQDSEGVQVKKAKDLRDLGSEYF